MHKQCCSRWLAIYIIQFLISYTRRHSPLYARPPAKNRNAFWFFPESFFTSQTSKVNLFSYQQNLWKEATFSVWQWMQRFGNLFLFQFKLWNATAAFIQPWLKATKSAKDQRLQVNISWLVLSTALSALKSLPKQVSIRSHLLVALL